jgi:hypothetical protein
MSDLTLREVKEKQLTLEINIFKLIAEFIDETSVSVTKVGLVSERLLDKSEPMKLFRVAVTLVL